MGTKYHHLRKHYFVLHLHRKRYCSIFTYFPSRIGSIKYIVYSSLKPLDRPWINEAMFSDNCTVCSLSARECGIAYDSYLQTRHLD